MANKWKKKKLLRFMRDLSGHLAHKEAKNLYFASSINVRNSKLCWSVWCRCIAHGFTGRANSVRFVAGYSLKWDPQLFSQRNGSFQKRERTHHTQSIHICLLTVCVSCVKHMKLDLCDVVQHCHCFMQKKFQIYVRLLC